MERIERVREASFRRGRTLKLVPERAKLLPLVIGECPEQGLGGGRLLRRDCHEFIRRLERPVMVASTNLDEVVDDQHLKNPPHVRARSRMFSQRQRHQRQVPAVLGSILLAAPVIDSILTSNRLEPVSSEQEINLAFDTR
jgi:hypothetical protein